MIAYKPKDVEFKNWKPLLYGYAKNKDGIGISFLKADAPKIVTNKTFNNFHTFWSFYKKNVAKEDVAIIHFRYATHGVKDTGNRHPFPVTTDRVFIRKDSFLSDDIIAHNGVFSAMSKYCTKDSVFSDTQEFVVRWFAPMVKLFKESHLALEILSNAISSSRIIYLHKDRTLIMLGAWTECNGIHYSNDNFKERPFKISKNYCKNGYIAQRMGFSRHNYNHVSTDTYKEEYKYKLDTATNKYVMVKHKPTKALTYKTPKGKRKTVRKCEHCKKNEGKDVVLKKYLNMLVCETCINVMRECHEQTLFDVCCKCGKSEMEEDIFMHTDNKGYCVSCLPVIDGIDKTYNNIIGAVCTECDDTIGIDEISFSIGAETVCAQCYKNFVGIE